MSLKHTWIGFSLRLVIINKPITEQTKLNYFVLFYLGHNNKTTAITGSYSSIFTTQKVNSFTHFIKS